MANFICPGWNGPTLSITHSIKFDGDARSDDISLQAIACSACDFRGRATYEESRRGPMDSESWHHDGSPIAPEDYKELVALLEACPDQPNDRCQCKSHQKLGKKDERGRWTGSHDFKSLPPHLFFMQRSQ